MTPMRYLLIILSDKSREQWASEVVSVAANPQYTVIVGSASEAAQFLIDNHISPSHILLDIGARGQDVFAEVDQLANQCEPGTRVLAVGDTNDIILYRGLLSRGVIDYLPMPSIPSEIVRVLSTPVAAPVTQAPAAPAAPTKPAGEKHVIAFISAAAGDGGSTAALNTAFALSQHSGPTILVDMDYQFGMVAKNLNLQNQYGIGDLFDHPERGLDATLIKRMVATYGKLHVITAPIELRYLPTVSADVIRDLVVTLQHTYDNVVIDLPHVWLPWVASVAQEAKHIVLVAQLWLKSVSNSARMMRVLREMNIPADRVTTVINRSGAKFKEAIDPKDFERVCGRPIRYTLTNDIKSVVNAEAAARTVLEMEPSELANDFQRLAMGIIGKAAPEGAAANKGGLFARLKG